MGSWGEGGGCLQGGSSTGNVSARAGLLPSSLGRWERAGGSAHPGVAEQSCAPLSPRPRAQDRLLASTAPGRALPAPGAGTGTTQWGSDGCAGDGKGPIWGVEGRQPPLPKHPGSQYLWVTPVAVPRASVPQASGTAVLRSPGSLHHPLSSAPRSGTATATRCFLGKTQLLWATWGRGRGNPPPRAAAPQEQQHGNRPGSARGHQGLAQRCVASGKAGGGQDSWGKPLCPAGTCSDAHGSRSPPPIAAGAKHIIPLLLTQAPPGEEGRVYLFLLICLNWCRSHLAGAIFLNSLGRGGRYRSIPAQVTHPSTPLHNPPDGASCRAGTVLCAHRTPWAPFPFTMPASCGGASPPGAGRCRSAAAGLQCRLATGQCRSAAAVVNGHGCSVSSASSCGADGVG